MYGVANVVNGTWKIRAVYNIAKAVFNLASQLAILEDLALENTNIVALLIIYVVWCYQL